MSEVAGSKVGSRAARGTAAEATKATAKARAARGSKEEREACPRCGMPISWVYKRRAGEREYYYAVHYLGRSGERDVVKRCYLGPKEYAYVTATHEGLGLTLKGLVEPKRVLDYLDSLLTALPHLEASREELARIAEKLELASKIIKEKIEEKASVEERARRLLGEGVEVLEGEEPSR